MKNIFSLRRCFSLSCPRDHAGLADDMYFDFARIAKTFFNRCGDITRKFLGTIVGNLAWIHHDAHFASCLNGICLFNARNLSGYFFDFTDTLNVVFERVAGCAPIGKMTPSSTSNFLRMRMPISTCVPPSSWDPVLPMSCKSAPARAIA